MVVLSLFYVVSISSLSLFLSLVSCLLSLVSCLLSLSVLYVPGRTPWWKNGGCLHFTCATCGHEFCWTCLATWGGADHRSFFECNKNSKKVERYEFGGVRLKTVTAEADVDWVRHLCQCETNHARQCQALRECMTREHARRLLRVAPHLSARQLFKVMQFARECHYLCRNVYAFAYTFAEDFTPVTGMKLATLILSKTNHIELVLNSLTLILTAQHSAYPRSLKLPALESKLRLLQKLVGDDTGLYTCIIKLQDNLAGKYGRDPGKAPVLDHFSEALARVQRDADELRRNGWKNATSSGVRRLA
jgi:IBR domain